MVPAIVVCTLLVTLSSALLENAGALTRPDSGTVFKSLENLIEVVDNLRTEMKVQASTLSNLVTKEELESILLNSLASNPDMKKQENSLKNLEAKAHLHENYLRNLQATVDELKTLLVNSSMKEEEQVASLNKLEQQSDTQVTTLLNVEAGLGNQTTLLNNLLTNEEIQSNKLTNLEANVAALGGNVETLTEGIQRATKGIAEGIIAGTSEGVFLFPLNSTERINISSNEATGVAYSWKIRKIYWIDYKVGIWIAEVDGSSKELLIADSSDLRGLAVDQITGNFYYGKKGSNPSIRVCDSMGKKCATVSSGVKNVGIEIWDIALFPSQGLMFWSNPDVKKGVTRANMDGTNATVIIFEKITGLYIDEFEKRIIWANENAKIIGNHDFNGNNRNVMHNTSINPFDVAVDGDTLYFDGYHPKALYVVTSNRKTSRVAETTGYIYHIDMYGGYKLPSRLNHCRNTPCANLCVLARASYTCL